ncbi:MAG: DUF4399 domain-containing protein [Vicinamibacterales bacterium]
MRTLHSFAVARLVGTLTVLAVAAACGGGPKEQDGDSPKEAPAPAAPAAPRVFFVEPADGATVKSPVHFSFGIEGFTIAAVPEGTVEQARDGVGHHHLGVDVGCLPDGAAIPKGTPGWVHFGKGDTTIDMQLTPGPHTFALQTGNDLHQTVSGLCETLSITVEP